MTREYFFEENRNQLPDFLRDSINQYFDDKQFTFGVIGTVKIYRHDGGKWIAKIRVSKWIAEPLQKEMYATDYVDLDRLKAHPMDTVNSSFWWCMTMLADVVSEEVADHKAKLKGE